MDNASALPLNRDRGAEGDEQSCSFGSGVSSSTFGDLYRLHLAGVYRYLRTRTATGDDAADLTQQVFLQALAAMPGYQDHGLPFAAWLFRIARNVAIDAHRRRRPMVDWEALPESRHPVAPGDPEAEALRRDDLANLRRLLDGLDPEERDVVTLHFVGGLSQREIALVLRMSQSTVQRRLARALQTLKERYGER